MTSLDCFGLALDTPLAVPTSRSYRPPSWPPPKDWVCIEDKDGNPVSRYGDHYWSFYPWTGKCLIFNFGDGPKRNSRSPVIDPNNAELLRRLLSWRIWGPRGARSVHTIIDNFGNPIRKIIALCSQNKILASDLSRYPHLIEKVSKTLAPSNFETIVAELDRLRDARELLGFELLDAAGIRQLKAAQPVHSSSQTEYIPPRIWTYVVTRLKECIDDYLSHQAKIEGCFAFCIAAYKQNGAREHFSRTGESTRNPFNDAPPRCTGRRSGITYHGPFADTAQRFGIREVLERWVGPIDERRGIQGFLNYFSLIQYAALADITAFTLMRIEEAASVRKDCLVWHVDELYGQIPLVRAETTKTELDDAALWITSPSIESSIHALTSIASMRLASAGWEEDINPYLITRALEPWGKPARAIPGVRPSLASLCEVVRNFPPLFDLNQLTITEDDYRIAKAVCPTLNADRFCVGRPWHLGWHQFRRTGAVNMFASGQISDSSIQLQMKHLTRLMPLYYGRGNSTLHLNEEARVLLVNAQYEAMGRQLVEVHTDRYVSPYGAEHKARLLATANDGEPVNLIAEGDAIRYEKAARKHQIGFRQTVLGACLKNGQCDGDCVSSVGDCAGGNGASPCSHVLFDSARASANHLRLAGVIKQLEATPPDSPRYRSLEQEKRGLENYFAHIRHQD